MTIKHDYQIKKEISHSREVLRTEGRKSVTSNEKYRAYQPPSEAIGIIAPKPLVVDNFRFARKSRLVQSAVPVRKKF